MSHRERRIGRYFLDDFFLGEKGQKHVSQPPLFRKKKRGWRICLTQNPQEIVAKKSTCHSNYSACRAPASTYCRNIQAKQQKTRRQIVLKLSSKV